MFYDRMKKTSRSPWPIVIMTAWCALLGEMTPWARAQELAVNERLPAIMVLPFRELKDATEGMGAGLTDLLTVRFANEIGFRVLEPASDGAVLRELEIVVTAQTPHHAPDRYGVDGILSGSIFVDGDRLLLTWRLSCLVEESETGGWHELETSSFFDAGFDQLATQIAPVIEQWAGKRRVAYARESELRAERLAALPSLARRVVLLRVREQSLHGEALDGGVSMGQVIEVCREAGLSVRSPSATGDLADALYIDGTAESEEPAYRAGRSVARASCTLRLREGDNPVAVVEATAARVFAASAPREAVNAALAGAAEDAALELLYKYEKRMRARTHQVAERPRSERGRTSRATCVAIDVDADRDDLLRAMRDLVAIALNDDPQFVPVIRELVDTSTRTGHATPSPAGALQVPATYSIVLSRIESDVAGHLLDTRTGELLAMATAALADGYGAAAQGLVAAMSRAIDAHVVDRPAPARWVAMGTLLDIDAGKVARERIAHWMLRRLLDRQDVRVLVRPWSWVVARERGLGLDDALLWECDAEVRAELAQGRKDDTPGLWLSMMLGMDGDDVEHHDPVFLSADASSSWDLRVGDVLESLLQHVPPRPGVLSESQTLRFASLGSFALDYVRGSSATAQRFVEYAEVEGQAHRTEDWYRRYSDSHDDGVILGLGVNRIRWPHETEPAHRIGPVVRARAARLLWEVEHGRVRGLACEKTRMHDRSVVIQAWENWRHVPLHDAKHILDAYLMAYHRHDEPPGIRCPDLVLACDVLEGHGSSVVKGDSKQGVPLHRIRHFFEGLARAECDGMQLLSRDGDALLAVLNYQRVTPEAYAAGAMHLLTTSNAYAFVVAMQPDEVRSGNVSEAMLLTAVMNRITGRLRHFSRNTSALDMRHEIRYPFHSLALRDKLLDYLRSAPRPLPLPVRRLLGASMRVPHTRVVVLGDAVRPEDPLPPLMEASPAAPATATTAAPPPSDTWSLHRVSDHTRWLNPNPSLAWVSGPRYYQIKSSSDRLQVQWMDVFTGETGDSGDVIQSLTDADTIVTGHSVRHFAFDGDHYLQIGRSFSRIEPDESLVRLPLFPGMSIRGMSCGIGRLLVTATPGRLQVWDRETDTLRDLANHKSTRPGGLNNRGRWDAVSLRPVLETGHVEALLLGSVRVDPPAAGFRQTLEQWSVDPASGQTTLLRRVYTSASLHAPGVRVVDTEDGFLIPKGGGLPGSPSARAWHLLPHAADRPIMSRTELRSGGPISQPVGGNHRIIGAELRGRHTGLVIIDGVDSGDYRTIRVIPSAADHVTARILRGQLLRIQNDLVIAADGYSGPYRIPNAFSRTLPPDGSEIRLVMAADRLPWRRCQPHFCSCASGYRDLSTDFTGDGQMR